MTISIAISCEQDELPALQAALAAFGGVELHQPGQSAECHPTGKLEPIPGRPELQEAKPERPDDAQRILRPKDKKIETDTKLPENDRKAAFGEHAANLQEASRKDEKVPFTEQQKAAILRMKAAGKGAKEIAKALGIPDARRVNGMIMLSKRQKVKPSGVPASGSSPSGGSQSQQNVNVAERSPTLENVDPASVPQQDPGIEAASAPDAKPYTRAVLNGLIWDLHRAGKNNEEISNELYKQGYCFSEDFVRERLKKIEEGRA